MVSFHIFDPPLRTRSALLILSSSLLSTSARMTPHDTLFEGSVEFVFSQPCEDWQSSSTTSLPSSPPTKDDDSSSSSSSSSVARRVSISEESNQVYEICKADTNLKNDLWYDESEYRRFMYEAGYKELPPPPRRRTRKSTDASLPLSPWIVRGLWLGSIIMGVLATSTTMTTKRTR